MYSLPTEDRGQAFDVPAQLEGLPDMKPEDQQYFGALLKVRTKPQPTSCPLSAYRGVSDALALVCTVKRHIKSLQSRNAWTGNYCACVYTLCAERLMR